MRSQKQEEGDEKLLEISVTLFSLYFIISSQDSKKF